MKTIKYVGLLSMLLMCSNIYAKLPPSSTKLYQKVAKGCKTVDITKWSHPNKELLEKNQFKVQQIQLCNKDTYPIFIGVTQYDLTYPPNVAYAKRFFTDLAQTNDKSSYAFVDSVSQKIFYVNVKRNPFKVSYEHVNYE